jgi:serine protease Do
MTPGTKISLGVISNGKPMTLNLTVGEYNASNEVATSDEGNGAQHGKLGIEVSDLTPDMRQQNNIPDQVHGVIVQNVRPGSPAEDAGIQPGNVILEINRKPAVSANQFANEVHQSGHDVLLLVWSKGNASFVTIHADGASQNG